MNETYKTNKQNMRRYFSQIWYEMRHQPLVMWISVGGTALAIFMVMVLFTVDRVSFVPTPPEDNRDRMMVGFGVDLHFENGSISSLLSDTGVKKLYSKVKGIKYLSFTNAPETKDVGSDGRIVTEMSVRGVDDVYWKMFGIRFQSGHPFTAGDVESGSRVAVIAMSRARELFNDDEVRGRTIYINQLPYRVTGVVEDVSPFFTFAHSDVWVPYRKDTPDEYSEFVGNTTPLMELESKEAIPLVKREVKARYERLNKKLGEQGSSLIYHQEPFTLAEYIGNNGNNNDPDPDSARMGTWYIYAVLLLLPAMNISSMTRSRLRRRVSEIGVRRALGATRREILGQFLAENLVMTVAGTVAGVLFSLLFCKLYITTFFPMENAGTWQLIKGGPSFSLIFNWETLGMAAFFCLVLNILSTILPAWKASRENPAEAISGKHD